MGGPTRSDWNCIEMGMGWVGVSLRRHGVVGMGQAHRAELRMSVGLRCVMYFTLTGLFFRVYFYVLISCI